MAHPVTWAKKKFFYPIGNTPPASFTSDLDAETSAAILLLGCGDPRSILYTVYSEPSASRSLDFTCCDAEPAILARNVLLLTMILDKDCNANQIKGTVWNMFFHLFLDKRSLDRVRQQCQKLVDLSVSIESWEKGKYSGLLRFCSAHTLKELHRQWCLYIMLDDNAKKSHLSKAFRLGMQTVRDMFPDSCIYTAGRSAGPVWLSVIQPGEEQYRRYWKTGVTFDDAAQVSAATFVNPTFAYDSSGEDFNVHYGTDPILAFHLGMAAKLPCSTKRNPSVSELVGIAKEQFKEWCLAFRERFKGGQANLVIRLWVGDALAFSKALRIFSETDSTNTGVYPSAWEVTPIILDGQDYSKTTQNEAPLRFDIIDTSNLMDHLGLLNILVATVPLLQDHPAATLYTNSLLNFEEAGGRFANRACTDIATLSLLLGIIPASYVSGFATRTNIHEVCMSVGTTSGIVRSYQELVLWKRAPTDNIPGPLQIAAKPLANILFNIYLQMFKDDDISRLSSVTATFQGFIHYHRSSFAAFLALVKQRVNSDWTHVMDYVMSLIERDKTLLTGLNNVQDLYCQFHIHEVCTASAMLVPSLGNHPSRVFDGWDDIPPAVCIVLQVPRKYLEGLESLRANDIGTPILQCEIESQLHQNIFSAIHFFFGTTTPSTSDPRHLIPNEDTTRWRGSSPLIVSFYVPSWLLTVQTPRTKVRLRIHPRSIASPMIYSVLGPLLCIFSADLLDKTHVQVVRRRPGDPREPVKLQGSNNAPESHTQLVSMLTDKDSKKVNGLTGKLNIKHPTLQATFRACPLSDIKVEQSSPFSMLVSIGQAHQEIVSFPYPIDGSNPKTRIARKSLYIEVDVGLYQPNSHQEGLTANPFPVVQRNSNLIPWNIHRVNLEKLPEVDITHPKCQWLAHHLLVTLSYDEPSGGAPPAGRRDLIQDISRTIRDIFISAGKDGNPRQAIIMRDPKGNSVPGEILMFLNCVRLDLPSHTIIADACAVPLDLLSDLSSKTFSKCLHKTQNGMVEIQMSSREIRAWWQLLPILAERCRTWSHANNCKFRSAGMSNNDPDLNISPLCKCGRGKSLPPSFLKGEYKNLAPFATRVAANNLLTRLGAIMRGESKASEVCDLCGKAGQPRLMRCSACGRAKYCSKECQKEDWKIHRVGCKTSNKAQIHSSK
ncbi:hypothetical protein J132_11080 [Termitomyces sp. J132]|nr:hypothetical protein J132_11080 [Termitomyces sp. J132]